VIAAAYCKSSGRAVACSNKVNMIQEPIRTLNGANQAPRRHPQRRLTRRPALPSMSSYVAAGNGEPVVALPPEEQEHAVWQYVTRTLTLWEEIETTPETGSVRFCVCGW